VIPKTLKQLRAALDLTHPAMAKLAGVTARSWQDYEAGIKTPGGKVFEALAQKGINTNWIFTGKGPMRFDRPDGANGPGLPPGFYGYLYGMALKRLAASPFFAKEPIEQLGENAAFVFDVVPLDENYLEQLQRIDAVIAWMVRVIHGRGIDDPGAASFVDVEPERRKKFNAEQARIVELIDQLAELGVQEHNLQCNFVEHARREEGRELDFSLNPEEIRLHNISAIRHTLITAGCVVFDPRQPERGLLESVKDLKDCIDLLDTLVGADQKALRDEIDRLLKLGLPVKPEHLTRNLPYESVAAHRSIEPRS